MEKNKFIRQPFIKPKLFIPRKTDWIWTSRGSIARKKMNSFKKKEKALLIAVFGCVWLISNAMRGVGFKLFLHYHFKSVALSFDELMKEFTPILLGKVAFGSQLKRVVGVFSSLFRPISTHWTSITLSISKNHHRRDAVDWIVGERNWDTNFWRKLNFLTQKNCSICIHLQLSTDSSAVQYTCQNYF